MSEWEEEEYEGPGFSVDAGCGKDYEFTPDNSELIRYTALPPADHFWLHEIGRIFRPQLANFVNLAEYAEENEYEINTALEH